MSDRTLPRPDGGVKSRVADNRDETDGVSQPTPSVRSGGQRMPKDKNKPIAPSFISGGYVLKTRRSVAQTKNDINHRSSLMKKYRRASHFIVKDIQPLSNFVSVVESDSEDDSSGEDGFDSDSNVRVIFKSDRNMRRSTQIASMSRQSVKLSPMPGSGGSSRLKQHRKSYSHAPSQPGNIHGRVSFSIRTGSRPGGGKRMLLTGMGDGKSKHGSDRGSSSKGGGGREMKRTGSIIQFNSQGSAINYPPLPVPGAPDTQISSSARADQNTAITSSHQKIKTNNNNNIKKDNYVDDGKGNREAKTAVVHSNTLTLDDENLPELGKDVEKGEEVKTRDDGVDDEVKAAQEIVKLFNDDELQCCCCACLKGKTPLRLLSWFCMFLFFLFGGVIMLDL